MKASRALRLLVVRGLRGRNDCVLVFIIFLHKQHFLILLIIRWWHRLMRTGLAVLLDEHGRIDVIDRPHFLLGVFSLVAVFVEV